MAYVSVPDPVLDIGKPGRSTDWKQFRDNQTDHESRINALEDASVRTFSHFSTLYNNASIIADATIVEGYNDWYFESTTADVEVRNGIYIGTDKHYIDITSTGASGAGIVSSKTGFYFDNRTKPLICTIRFKVSLTSAAGWGAFYIGLAGTNINGISSGAGQPVNGIYVMRSDANNWICRSRRNSVNAADPAAFAKLDAAWNELIITWVTAAKTATLTLNAAEVAVFTDADTIPSDKVLYPYVQVGSPAAGALSMYIDRIECYAGGALTDAV